jgi:hypothetical protein
MSARIPVTVAVGEVAAGPGVATIRLQRMPGHAHEDAAACPACMAVGDVRARLADLLATTEVEGRVPFAAVLVLAPDAESADEARRALRGETPARALRDHQVARRFSLDAV